MKTYELTVESVHGYCFSETFSDDYEAINIYCDLWKNGIENDDGEIEPINFIELKEVETSGGIGLGERVLYSERIYTTYAPTTDITFIMTDSIAPDTNNKIVMVTRVKGFVYGGISEDDLTTYFDKLEAVIEM